MTTQNVNNLYETLELNRQEKPSCEQIRKAYKKLALQYHPDRHGGNQLFQEKFVMINAAYTILSDEKKRKDYDSKLIKEEKKGAPWGSAPATEEDKEDRDIGKTIQEDLKWVSDIILTIYDLYEQYQMINKTKTKTEPDLNYSQYIPVKPIVITEEIYTDIYKDIVNSDVKNVSKVNGDILEVNGTFRQYQLKRKKRFQISLPDGNQKVITIPIRPGIQEIKVDDKIIYVRVNIL